MGIVCPAKPERGGGELPGLHGQELLSQLLVSQNGMPDPRPLAPSAFRTSNTRHPDAPGSEDPQKVNLSPKQLKQMWGLPDPDAVVVCVCVRARARACVCGSFFLHFCGGGLCGHATGGTLREKQGRKNMNNKQWKT